MSRGAGGWIGIALLLVAATLGEGGAAPTSLLVWHALVVGLLLREVTAGDRASRPASAPMVALLAFLLVAACGAMVAPYDYAAWLFVLDLGAFVAVVWTSARRGVDLLERLVAPLLVAAAAQSLLFLFQRFVADETRPAGTLLNPNHFAAWAVAVLLLAWGEPSAWSAGTRRARAWRAAATVPVVISVILVGSRGAVVGLVAGLVVALAPWWRGGSSGRRRLATVLALLAVVLVSAGLATRLRQVDPFRYQRLRIWSASLRIFADSPWVGTGPRQFSYAARNHQFPDGDGPLQYDRGFRTTHSDWLRVPCELGLAGIAALGLVLGSLAREARRRDRPTRPSRTAAAAALTALAAQSAVENLSSRPAVYLLAAVLLGASIARPRRIASVRSRIAVRAVAAGALALVFAVGDVAPYLAWLDARGLPEGALDASGSARLDRALERNPLQPDYSRRRAESLAQADPVWTPETYATAREDAERAVRLNPAGAENHLALARVEARACRTLFRDRGTRQRAVAAYDRATSLDRFNPFLPLEEAGFLLGDARDLAADASSWVDSGPYAREMLILDESDVRRLEAALAAASLPPGG